MHNSAQVVNEAEALSVAILVENEVLRRGMEAVLLSMPMVGSVRRCTSADEITALLPAQQLDILMVSGTDLEWLADAREVLTEAGTKVLVLVDESAANDPSGYAAVPVDGFLLQQSLCAETLRNALTRCAAGEVPMPAALARALLASTDPSAQRHGARVGRLTSRETEALGLLVMGLSNKQIARRLAISSHGVKRLVASIMLKLDSPNRTTAVVNAIRAGLVDCK